MPSTAESLKPLLWEPKNLVCCECEQPTLPRDFCMSYYSIGNPNIS